MVITNNSRRRKQPGSVCQSVGSLPHDCVRHSNLPSFLRRIRLNCGQGKDIIMLGEDAALDIEMEKIIKCLDDQAAKLQLLSLTEAKIMAGMLESYQVVA
ncbi:unnamed protein product, partial [Choristocarpus tenellus]